MAQTAIKGVQWMEFKDVGHGQIKEYSRSIQWRF